MKRAICIIVAAVALMVATPAATPAPIPEPALPSPYFIQLDLVEQVVCGSLAGSGARIDGNLVVTAEHVAAGGACMIDGESAEVAFIDPTNDIAVLRTAARSPVRMAISCNGFAEGRTYFAVGYAFGAEFVVQRLIGTRSKAPVASGRWRGQTILRGQTFQGMSGGPIVDESGAVVGIVNASPKSGVALAVSLPLAGTYLCRD